MMPYSKTPSTDTVTDLKTQKDDPKVGGRFVRSEQAVMGEGQYDGSIEQGPERRNPEGSVDISNEQAGHDD